jgi:hypothetical protein
MLMPELRRMTQSRLADNLPLVMFGAFAAGWGIPAVALAIALIFSGVSFRFGGKEIRTIL